MKNNIQKSPLQLMITICEQGHAKQVENLLVKSNNTCNFVSLASGTDESEVASLFGFGSKEREVVFSVVPTHQSELLVQSIANQMTFTEGKKRGIVLTVDFSGVEKEFLNFVTKKGETNGK